MPIPDEDSLRDYYDRLFTRDDPHSPWYEPPEDDHEDDSELFNDLRDLRRNDAHRP